MPLEVIPGADAVRRVLGPTADLIGEDLAKLYAKGRDRLMRAATRKVPDLDDGKCANLRVARMSCGMAPSPRVTSVLNTTAGCWLLHGAPMERTTPPFPS